MTNFNYDPRQKLRELLPESAIAEVDHWIAKFPADRKRPPIIPALKLVQDYNGNSLTEELMEAVAEYLDVPKIAVFEVATFYSMFNLKPMGKHVISVCTNLSCMLRGSKNVVEHLQNRLNIKLGETTTDGIYTLKEVECLGACGGAPMLEVDKQYHENLTDEKIDQILSDIAAIELNNNTEEAKE